ARRHLESLVRGVGARAECNPGRDLRPPALRNGRQSRARAAKSEWHAPLGAGGDELRAGTAEDPRAQGVLERADLRARSPRRRKLGARRLRNADRSSQPARGPRGGLRLDHGSRIPLASVTRALNTWCRSGSAPQLAGTAGPSAFSTTA